MWRERYMTACMRAVAATLALALLAGCAPDGPSSRLPTHPGDTHSVTLEWDAPTTDAIGRPLDDLSGYRLYYRDAEATVGSEMMVEVGADTRVTVEGLTAGDYLFAVTALDTLGNESDLSEPLPVEVGS